MMYAKGNDFIKDFAERTKSNLAALENSPYEVTQLINSMVGLLIIPQQRQFKKITDTLIDSNLLNKMENCIKQNTYKKPINLQEICRHLRNAVAHSRIEFEAEKPNIISKPLIVHFITFTDENSDTGEHIAINVTVDLLKDFLIAFSESIANLP